MITHFSNFSLQRPRVRVLGSKLDRSVRNSVCIRPRFTGTTGALVGFYVMVSGFIRIRNEGQKIHVT